MEDRRGRSVCPGLLGDIPGFTRGHPTHQETPQYQTNRDGWSACCYMDLVRWQCEMPINWALSNSKYYINYFGTETLCFGLSSAKSKPELGILVQWFMWVCRGEHMREGGKLSRSGLGKGGSPAEVQPQPDAMENSGLWMVPQSCPTLWQEGWPFVHHIIQPLGAGYACRVFLTKGNSQEGSRAMHY